MVLIVAADQPFTAATADLKQLVNGLFVRQNNGYDFAAWAHILRLHPEFTTASILYLLNDSVFGPTNDTALKELLNRVRDSRADVVGLTESFERGWHLQSYFLALKTPALASDAFWTFVESIVCYFDKTKVIFEYELRFATFMRIAGFRCEALFAKTDFRNPTLFHWRHLLNSGFPFLKVTLLSEPSFGIDRADWREVLAARGYDVSLAERTLREISAAGLQEVSPHSAPSLGTESTRVIGRHMAMPERAAAHKRAPDLKILIFSHELSESGAPRAAFDVARALRDAGHTVVVASRTGGPYQERLCDIGIEVIVDERLFDHDRNIRDLARNFDKVLCNTIVCWPVVAQLHDIIPVYWYVHESQYIHTLVKDNPGLLAALRSGVTFLAPSALPANALAAYGAKAQLIGYGVEDLAGSRQAPTAETGKVVIGVFGSYESRKGQDLAVSGMLRVPQEARERAEMRLFGRTLDPAFRRDIEAIAANDPSIAFFEEVDHDECLRQMAASDIILVPSRDDPLPFISLDALSLGKTLVCSATTGTSAYISSGGSGLVLTRNTPDEIAVALASAISDPEMRLTLGCGARQVYEENFTEEVFAAKICRLLAPNSAPAAEHSGGRTASALREERVA